MELLIPVSLKVIHFSKRVPDGNLILRGYESSIYQLLKSNLCKASYHLGMVISPTKIFILRLSIVIYGWVIFTVSVSP